MTPKFQISSQAWLATFESSEAYVTCPDCGGTGRIRAILYDDTIVSIPCEGCTRGYDPPTGTVPVYDRTARAELVTVIGLTVETDGKLEYRTTGRWCVPEEDLFETEAGALEAARAMAARMDEEQRARVSAKEMPLKSWAWHVHYHRDCIRRAEKDIAYHSAKLNAAKVKAKEDS